ncbi:MAG: pyridoxamine 5'-phosphate oxidase [Chitinophagales bacterium]
MDLKDQRKVYEKFELHEESVKHNPFDQFKNWFVDTKNSEILEANAMTLATASKDGKPSARIVLLKEVTETGFVFFTNYNSQKGKDLAENPQAEILFFWDALERQVRIGGNVKKISQDESRAYFDTRPPESRAGAIASPQSQKIESRAVIEEKIKTVLAENKLDMPENWGGYILEPNYFEFWQGRHSRLHDRIIYELLEGNWKIGRLAP